MSEHTPAPWRFDTRSLDIESLSDLAPAPGAIARVRLIGPRREPDPEILREPGYEEWDYRFPEAEANARLIAAAPDLLAACEAALSVLPPADGSEHEYHGFYLAAARKCAAAIAKARGEAS